MTHFESAADLNNEESIARYMKNNFDIVAGKLSPYKYNLDYAFYLNGDLYSWAEIKTRTNPMNQFETYILDVGKLHKAQAYANLTGKRFDLLVLFTDKLAAWSLYPNSDLTRYDFKFQSSSQPNGDRQEQPCIHIPMAEFSEITKAEFVKC